MMFGFEMADKKLTPTTKRYAVNSNGVNNYGFRVISQGVDQSQYNNNKIMLWMHYRPSGARKDEVLALGVGDDLKIDGDGLMDFQPMFDLSDDFAKSIYDKYESEVYNMFSLCALPQEMSVEPADMLPGQTGPTITKSLLKEISAVDIGGNPDAHGIDVALCDDKGDLIKLSDGNYENLNFLIKNKPMAKLITITAAGVLSLVKLSDDTSEAEVMRKLTELIQLADANNVELVQLRDGKAHAEAKVIELTSKVTGLENTTSEVKLAGLIVTAPCWSAKITPKPKARKW